MSLLDVKLDKLIDEVHKATRRERNLEKALAICAAKVRKEDLVEELQAVFFKYVYAYLFLYSHLEKTEAQLKKSLLAHRDLLNPKLISQILSTHREALQFLAGKESIFDSLKEKDIQYFRSSAYDVVRFLLYKVVYSKEDRQAVHNIYSRLFEEKRYREILVSTLVRSAGPGDQGEPQLTPQTILDNLVATGFAVPVTEDLYLFHVRGSGRKSLDTRELFPPLREYDVLAFDFFQSLEAGQSARTAETPQFLLENTINPDPSYDSFHFRPSSKCTVLRACATRGMGDRQEELKPEFLTRNAREGEVLTVVGVVFKTRGSAASVEERGSKWAFFSEQPWSSLVRFGRADPGALLLSAHRAVRERLASFCRRKGRVPKPSLFFTQEEVGRLAVEALSRPAAPSARRSRPPRTKRPLVVVPYYGPCEARAARQSGTVVQCVHHCFSHAEAISRFGEVSVEDLLTCSVCGEIMLNVLAPPPRSQYAELLYVPPDLEPVAKVVDRLLQDKFAKALNVLVQPTLTPLVLSLLRTGDDVLPYVVCALLVCFGEADLQRITPPKKKLVPPSLLFPTDGNEVGKLRDAPTLLFLLDALVGVVVSYVDSRAKPAEFAERVGRTATALLQTKPEFRARFLARRLFFRCNRSPRKPEQRRGVVQATPGPKREPFSVVPRLLGSRSLARPSWRWYANDNEARGRWTPLPSVHRVGVDFSLPEAGLVRPDLGLSLEHVLAKHFYVDQEDAFVVAHDARGNPTATEVVVPAKRFTTTVSDARFGFVDTLSYTDEGGASYFYDSLTRTYLGFSRRGKTTKVPPRARLVARPGFLEVMRVLGAVQRASEDETVFFHSALVSSLRVLLSRLARVAFVGLEPGRTDSGDVLATNVANCLNAVREQGEKKKSEVLGAVLRWAQAAFRDAFPEQQHGATGRPPRVVKEDWVEVQEEKVEDDVDVFRGNNLERLTDDLDVEPEEVEDDDVQEEEG